MDRKALLSGFALNMDYTIQLVQDVEESQMTEQPNGFANHPAFTLGHLVTATAMTADLLGRKYDVREDWDEMFRRKGPGDPRRPDDQRDHYPSKAELLGALRERYEIAVALIEEADEAKLQERYKWKLDSYMPTIGELLHFMCLLHHAWHIGQLAEWRRMMGYDSALAKLMKA